ncbi:hypothetical protein IMSAG049_00412 [Clostridiales bacterium]|nr:hypothetical protein IMSAG049_00412 [Clostridiales bacterium]
MKIGFLSSNIKKLIGKGQINGYFGSDRNGRQA